MKRTPIIPTATAALRRSAEARVRKQQEKPKGKAGDPGSAVNPQQLLHELQVHQVELELQNAELQKARNELEAALENSTDLYDFSPMGYLSLDELGVILEANLTGSVLLGVERSRLINRRLVLMVSSASQPTFLAFLKNAFTGRGDQACEALLLKEGGGTFWAGFRARSAVSTKESRSWCRVTFANVTERKESEAALNESEKRYRTLFELVPLAVYSCDASGVIQKFNRSAADLWGREPAPGDTDERFCGSFKLFRCDGSFMPHDQCLMSEVVSGKTQAVRDAEVLIERPDGSRITVVVNIHALKNGRGEITGAINCFYDITERKKGEDAQRRIEVLAASNQKLEQEIVRRQAVEQSLRKSEQHQIRLLEQARQMQEQLRHLSRQVLRAQEEERKRISRELHDVIAQTLTGINVQLAALKKEAAVNPKRLDQKIARTQKLVEHSVNVVHRFARELRPTVLDDLGLIPALHAFMKSFREETGIRVSLSASAAVERVNGDKRTVLYRCAQEALTNAARHARASRVDVVIQKLDRAVCMKIKDDGKGFPGERVLHARKSKRLGLLGMRERLEMVGGSFSVTSAPGRGTTIQAQIPLEEIGAVERRKAR